MKSPDISDNRDMFHPPWVSGLFCFTFLSLSPDSTDHILEIEAQMKKYLDKIPIRNLYFCRSTEDSYQININGGIYH